MAEDPVIIIQTRGERDRDWMDSFHDSLNAVWCRSRAQLSTVDFYKPNSPLILCAVLNMQAGNEQNLISGKCSTSLGVKHYTERGPDRMFV